MSEQTAMRRSKTITSNPEQPVKPNGSHSLTWWLLKNASAVGLIACMVLAVSQNWQKLLNAPIWWGQGLILIGASNSLFHYCLLKRSHPNLEKPAYLVSDKGLFSHVRHPMYMGDLLMFTGFWLMTPLVINIPILLLGYIAIVKQAMIEDHFIAARFPKEFSAWSAGTRLLMPWPVS